MKTGDATAPELISVIRGNYPKADVADVIRDFTCGSWHSYLKFNAFKTIKKHNSGWNKQLLLFYGEKGCV